MPTRLTPKRTTEPRRAHRKQRWEGPIRLISDFFCVGYYLFSVCFCLCVLCASALKILTVPRSGDFCFQRDFMAEPFQAIHQATGQTLRVAAIEVVHSQLG